jgi:hypothetical protein
MKRFAIVSRSGLLCLGVLAALAPAALGDAPATAAVAPAPAGVTLLVVPTSPTTIAEPPASIASPAVHGAGVPVAAASEPGTGGMVAYIDPESGELGGMPPEPLGEDGKPGEEPVLEPVTLPDGSLMLDLKGTGQEYFVLQRDAAGRPVVRCVQDPKTVRTPPQPEDR